MLFIFKKKKKILKHCVERSNKWANEIHFRLMQVLDLPAAEATTGNRSDIETIESCENATLTINELNSREESDEEQKQKIIETAAILIKSDINDIVNTKDVYPSFTDISSTEKNIKFLPESLKTFIGELIPENRKVKTALIGQSIMQSSRPTSLGVQVHHHFGSRFLIDTLNSLGFCCSYSEVQKYDSVVNTHTRSRKRHTLPQFVADNVDHNIRTLDGHNTFHGMGIVAASTPGSDVSVPVPRKDISMEEVSSIGNIKGHIVSRAPRDVALTSVRAIRYTVQYRPSWSGFMQIFENPSESFPKKSAITFMPMIDLNPSNATCIYSTLHFVCNQSKMYGKTPVLTFDQPLYQKAMDIVCSEVPSSLVKMIVLRLGGFRIIHLNEFSWKHRSYYDKFWSARHPWNGVCLKCSYTYDVRKSGTASHKRSHAVMITLYIFCFLRTLQNEAESESPGTNESEGLSKEMLQDNNLVNVTKVYDVLGKENSSLLTIGECESLKTLYNLTHTERQRLANNSTARLWIQYMDIVSILQNFIRAERTGN
ncbi:LOW QUALITY PROTEIN: hypothetical protein MAR_019492 [Mya arenaria]|uniref:Uncharacterized protein n=1 Tax=Mya arenaria TaxID=6604 RepID=A0ABY7E266_MYAAR|nr:LOW QUALITY PROTEIN: hypothetical protein MAR_019492 [Mya arenaria]